MSVEEMKAIRKASFGEKYQRIYEALESDGNAGTKGHFRQMEDLLFFLITYIIANQDAQGWWNYTNPYYKVLTAHAVRHLHSMGLTLKSRWNLYGRNQDKGNLLYSTEQLLNSFNEEPTEEKHSLWENDVWDDCWILLALLEVQPEFKDKEIQRRLPGVDEFERNYRHSVAWLQEQFDKNGFNESVKKADWFGPAHYSAAIELFAHPKVKDDFPQAEDNIKILAAAARSMFEEDPSSRKWEDWFAWHVGQFLVTWQEKREDHPPLQELDGLMKDVFKELQDRRQDTKKGFWGLPDSNETDKVYNTVRGLASCYVNTSAEDLLNSTSVSSAHKYLLHISRNNSGPIQDVKGSINTLEALQKLFEFKFRGIFPNMLFILANRLNSYGLLDNILSPRKNDHDTLKDIRAAARRRLERQGKSSLEVLGVNDQLFQSLNRRDEFLKEFAGDRHAIPPDKREEIRSELTRFLSATITETRSRSARRLIKGLWQTDGFLNFIPLIEHLAQLEQDGAFYKYYRDHLNHEVLLFLLGAYIYYNCAAFRKPVDDEICEIYEAKRIRFDRRNLEGEFLFRWKLISTFHDIGYLFEVDPVDKSRTKEEVLAKSFGVVDEFRKNFLYDYFLQYIQVKPKAGLSAKEAATEREKEVRALAEEVAKGLKTYDSVIEGEEDLFELMTVEGDYRNAFKSISRYVKPRYIDKNLIEAYFNLCATTPVSKERDAFLDHGIMSALVLLKAADIQRHYLWELTGREFAGTLLENYPQLRDILDRPDTRAHLGGEQFFIRFSHVAGAIALHNISPHLYTEEQCKEFDDKNGTNLKDAFYQPIGKPTRYLISLSEHPLSYLTALADTLQDWDRHSFRRLSFGDDSGDPLSSSEVTIGFEDNKLDVRPLTSQANEKYQSLTKPGAMDQYLQDWRKYVTLRDPASHR